MKNKNKPAGSEMTSRRALIIFIAVIAGGLAIIALILLMLFNTVLEKTTSKAGLGTTPVEQVAVSPNQSEPIISVTPAETTEPTTSAEPTPSEDPVPSAEPTATADPGEPTEPAITTEPTGASDMNSFYITEINDEIFARIDGISYPKDCPIPLSDLRYVHVLHYNFEGGISEGELIVAASIAEEVIEIFTELFEIEYPIEKMILIDAYGGDDERSMEDNNSSAFNYRYIAESTTLSNHALGLAIDINTLYNPYVYTRSDGSTFLQPYNAGDYVDRTTGNPYYILPDDACVNIFKNHGFSWGGDWKTKKDYQHFEFIGESHQP